MAGVEKSEKAERNPLSAFRSPLLTREIEMRMQQTASIQTMEFLWHCSASINNRGINKTRGDMPYPELPRMELIPLYAWPVPVIKARNASFSIGNPGIHGASMGPSGVSVGQRSMLSHESRGLLEKWYGNEGVLVLESITTNTDQGKLDALLLYHAVMNATRSIDGQQSTAGSEMVIEDLPEFLEKEAPHLLEQAIKDGVQLKESPFWPGFKAGRYRVEESLATKGLALIEDLKRNVEATIAYVLDDERGVLKVTRGQLQQAAAGIKDTKTRTDRRDEFFITQFPGFSLDTAVERAARGSAAVVKSIEKSSVQSTEVQTIALHSIQEMLEELRAQRAESALLREKIEKLEKVKSA